MKRSGPAAGGLVYSTDGGGRMCPGCRQPVAGCRCPRQPARPVGDGVARVSRSSAGRGGKVVTLVRGLALDDAALAALGKQLRMACGSGGTVRDGQIEVQGDHVERVMAALQAQGHTVRRVGG